MKKEIPFSIMMEKNHVSVACFGEFSNVYLLYNYL